jgi:predicted transcriptional regulator
MREKNMTQKECTKKLNVSEAYISKIFKGDINFTLDTIYVAYHFICSN